MFCVKVSYVFVKNLKMYCKSTPYSTYKITAIKMPVTQILSKTETIFRLILKSMKLDINKVNNRKLTFVKNMNFKSINIYSIPSFKEILCF